MTWAFDQLLPLMLAIIMAESSGDNMAVGYQDGKPIAFGCMQITDGYRENINSHYGTTYTRQDCFSRRKSTEMFYLYMNLHGANLMCYRELAALHRKGPRLWCSDTGMNYWINKVEPYYDKYKDIPPRDLLRVFYN